MGGIGGHGGPGGPGPEDPRDAQPGDVWADDTERMAFLHWPDETAEDAPDPFPWMQIWPPVPSERAPERWHRTRDLPPGLRLALRAGQAVTR